MNTPETDALLHALRGFVTVPVVAADRMRELERQRNEARREAAQRRNGTTPPDLPFPWEHPQP